MAWTYSLTYTQVNDYSAKDALSSGDAEKIILGADVDAELSGIATALNSKLDAGSVSSGAEAAAGQDTESVMTPNNVTEWADSTSPEGGSGAGIVGDLWRLADPGADRILFWDDSAGTATGLTAGDGLDITTTTLTVDAGAGLTYDTGALVVGAGNGITVNANDVALTDQAASTTVPVSLSSGTLGFDITALTDFGTAAGVDLDTDTLIVSDGPGTNKEIKASQLVTPEVPAAVTGATDTLAETDFGKTIQYSNASPVVTLPNGLKAGFWATLIYTGTPGSGLQITATTTLNTYNSLDTCVTQYGVITVLHLGSNVWVAWGNLEA